MEVAKLGQNTTSNDRRKALLHSGQGTAYDIYKVRGTFSTEGAFSNGDDAAVAVSVRDQDQVDDNTDVDMATMASAPGIFAKMAWNGTLVVEGGSLNELSHDVDFNRPFRVPYLAALIHQQGGTNQVGVEVYFERVKVSKLELAQLISEAGGRART